MPPRTVPTPSSLLPEPGTAEAIELGCTCHSIAHLSVTDEREPAGVLLGPDSNCPLHGAGPLSHDKPMT
jgi:hypothetical protein